MGSKFYQEKKKNNWFCNTSSFCGQSEIESNNFKLEENMNIAQESFEFDDSHNDPDYVPDSDHRSSSENEILKPRIQILQNVVVVPAVSTSKMAEKTNNSKCDVINNSNDHLTSNDSNSIKEVIYKRKKNMCYFCESDVLNFVRHLKRNHFYELEVHEIFSKQKNSKEKRELLAILKKKGNFINNSNECLQPVKHRKKFCDKESSKNAQANVQSFMLKKSIKIDERLKDEVFPKMRADKISLEAKSDFLICAFGARYLKIHREKHFINVTSRKMRELSRVLIKVKEADPTIKNLFEALHPKYYDTFVEVTKVVAKYDNVKDVYISPTFAMNIATSLKQCCDIAIQMIIKEQLCVETGNFEASLKTMINLLQSNWRFDVSNQAANDLNIKKFNKITIVPLELKIPYLFGKPGLETPLYDYKTIAKFAIACGAKNPEAITCTKLRKHLATLTQLFSLNENEVEQLSSYMGHDLGTHRSSYRLPDDVYQTDKVSKLLLLMEKGQDGKNKDKSLDEIPIDLEDNLLNHNKDKDSSDEEENVEKQNLIYSKQDSKQELTNTENHVKKISVSTIKVRILVPWTDEQPNILKSTLKIENRPNGMNAMT
ncbi:hypothetical protein FQR65_LT17267 [Abscondita terminalis]|nr:hypothetical protein FQR65_LT17267 [Abscondita terminalis]